ncbi:MAG: asparagine synthase (glutamine-hydrolyzing) [Bacteroidales bacterium]
MCGINGVWHSKQKINKTHFILSRDRLQHRGPDDAGLWFNEDENIGFGHRRLAFMDLSESGRQPMQTSDGSVIVTVNGEIYNYPELKNELEGKGYHFFSRSDSEVLLYAWQEWHTGMLKKLNGMFAFALYDKSRNEMLLARDRFGIKPLYYHRDAYNLIFASEIKAIINYAPELKTIRSESMADYFSYRYIPSPHSIYESIKKLEPASFLLIGENTDITEKYWTPPENTIRLPQPEITEKIHELLSRSVRMHTQSDVPVGAFLSGGYDSSAIVSLLHDNKIDANTYSIGFSNWENSEDRFAKLVAETFDMPHYSKIADRNHLEMLENLMQHYDEPIADISILPTWLVSQLASEQNKAVLSGEGADELFGGYTWHYENLLAQKQEAHIWRKNPSVSPFSVESYSRAMAMGHLRKPGLEQLFTGDFRNSIPEDSDWFYRQHASGKANANRFRRMDLRCFMGELVLTKVDRASMAHSLEVRVPFLENELADFMLRLSPKQIYKSGVQKFQLYQIIKNKLPREILERKKQGFVGPDRYYRSAEWYRGIISESKLVHDGIINQSELNHYLQNHMYWKLWKFAVLENWYKTWM